MQPIPQRLLSIKATWQQPGTADGDYGGDEQPDWSDDARTDHENIDVYVEQRDTTELVDGRTTVVSRLVLIANETGFAAADRIVIGDTTYEIDGAPAVFTAPTGPQHSESTLKLVTG